MPGQFEGHLPEDRGQENNGLSGAGGVRLAWSRLLRQTYSLYLSRFRTFFLIALPPAVLAYLWRFMQRIVVGAIRANGWMPRPSSPGYWATLTLVALLEGAIYWVISGFFFAAVSSNVLGEDNSEQPLVGDAYTQARERLVAVAGVGLLIWSIFAISRGILGFALFTIFDRLRLSQNAAVIVLTFATMLLLLAGLLSRFALAIPMLMDDPGISVWQSLRRSLSKTENWELFFILFLAKAAIVGYAAYWLVNLGLDNLEERDMLGPEAYPWVQSLLYVCLGAILESPLFIAFSLVYCGQKAVPSESAAAPVQ